MFGPPVDVDSRRVIAVEASWRRSSMSAEQVLRRTLKACLNKPLIYVDRGP
jgi:transposase-like protein